MLERLLDAFDGVPEKYVEEAARAMDYLPRKRKKPIVRNLLLAAVLTGLLAATAVASGLYSRSQRLAEMPTTPKGESRVALIPNGFQGSPTYQGSAEWWAFDAEWQDAHENPANFDLEFTKGDLEKYQICGLYNAYEEEQADKLFEIAEKYDLKLYKEVVHYDEYGGKEFFSLTGCEPFAENMEGSRFAGYVFDDGSFKLETEFQVNGEEVWATVTRIRSGSIYPYGGAGREVTQYEETEYLTKKGQTVFLSLPEDTGHLMTGAIVDYVTPDGKTWISADLWSLEGGEKDWLQQAKDLSDAVDFEALSVRNEGAKKILEVPTAAEDNRSTVEKLESFKASNAVKANEAFGAFFHENFYGTSFTGTYGMDGYSDIDEKLQKLAEEYGLTYASHKSTGNDFYENAVVYDNGSWSAQISIDEWGSKALLNYIPKNALNTAWVPPLEISQYRRVWDYETQDGLTLACYSEGPSVIYGDGALLETDQAYILLTTGGTVPKDLQQAADLVDWAGLVKGEPSK